MKIAATGNIIDFGAVNRADLDIEKEFASIDQRGFGVYHFDQFYARLQTADTLLYLCDNSGEIVLDKVFIEEIKRSYPSLKVTCAVREKPVINDAIVEDARYIGLEQVATVISSGSVYPGTLLDESSNEFKRLFNESDLIVSKGQGNFETLLNTPTDKMFFILRIKCGVMARLSRVQKGDLVLMQSRTL